MGAAVHRRCRTLIRTAWLAVLMALPLGCGAGPEPAGPTAASSEAPVSGDCTCDQLTAPVAIPQDERERARWERVGRSATAFRDALYRIILERPCNEVAIEVDAHFQRHEPLRQEWKALTASTCWHFDRWLPDPEISAEDVRDELLSCDELPRSTWRRISEVMVLLTCARVR